jgi:hypothetical protein
MTAPDLIPDDARQYNGELAETFGFQERDAIIAAKYGYGGMSPAALARISAARAAHNTAHAMRLAERLDREGAQAMRWAMREAQAMRQADQHTAAELIEARARYFATERGRDRRA